MSDHKEGAAGLEPGDGGVTMEEAQATAAGIVDVMRAALEAAVGASNKPGQAYAGLLLATRSLRATLQLDGPLSEDATQDALEFVRATFVGEAKESCISVARLIIREHCTEATASHEDLQSVVNEAATCIDRLLHSGTVKHPVTMLVVLYAARQMAFALLKHQHPDEYEHLCSIAKAMENAVKPKAIGVVTMPANMHFSKGGDA